MHESTVLRDLKADDSDELVGPDDGNVRRQIMGEPRGWPKNGKPLSENVI